MINLNLIAIAIITLIINYLLLSNRKVHFRKLSKEEKMKARTLTDEEFINTFLPYIIQLWEKNGKAKGMSLDEYINVYIRMENK